MHKRCGIEWQTRQQMERSLLLIPKSHGHLKPRPLWLGQGSKEEGEGSPDMVGGALKVLSFLGGDHSMQDLELGCKIKINYLDIISECL